MGTMGTFQWGIALACFAFCYGSHGPRGRPSPSVLTRPLMLVETDQGLSQGLGQGLGQGSAVVDDAALMELDQLFNLFQTKGKRSQELSDKVLQPGNAGMWFGPRLGRRRRRSVPGASLTPTPTPSPARRRKRSMPQDSDVDNDIPWKLAELLRELQGAKRSPALCDPTEINCILASLANGGPGFVPEQEQRPRSEGNLVNFTPRLGRESGEQMEAGEDAVGPADADNIHKYLASPARQLRTDSGAVWGFSSSLGRRLLPPGTIELHEPSGVPPSPASLLSRSRAGRSARSTAGNPGEATEDPKADDNGATSQDHAHVQ